MLDIRLRVNGDMFDTIAPQIIVRGGDDRVVLMTGEIAPLATFSLIVHSTDSIVIRAPPVCLLVFTISEPHSTIVLLFTNMAKPEAMTFAVVRCIEPTTTRGRNHLRRAGRTGLLRADAIAM